jgi:hypothetical protein
MVHSRSRGTATRLTMVCGLSLLIGVATNATARAQVVFRGITSVSVNDGVLSGNLREQGIQNDTATPENLALLGFSKTYDNGATFNASAAANYRGFFSTGTYAMGEVLNASYPTVAPEFLNINNPFGYYVIGGMGSFTKHRFVTPESLTGVFGTFNWHVDGTATSTFGLANSRLDFAVTQGASVFDDLYNASITPNKMTQFGPGSYSYTTGIALDTPLDFLFWSSSFWQVQKNDLATLGTTHRDIRGSALFNDTFTLDSIELRKADGTLVNNWSLLDEATGQTIFTQNGRVTAQMNAPEPGSLALLLPVMGVAGIVIRKQKRRVIYA